MEPLGIVKTTAQTDDRWWSRTLRRTLQVVLAGVLAGCTSLQGIPKSMSTSDKQNLSSTALPTVLRTADDLSSTYQQARDDNLRYAFWSNATLVPTAGAAAGAAFYKATPSVLARIGIAAGMLIGFNGLINARANAKAYQSGIDGLTCITTKLGSYQSKQPAALASSATDLLNDIGLDQTALTASQAFSLTLAAAQAEITADPGVVGVLAQNEKQLTTAITNAQQAYAAAEDEIHRWAALPSFASDSIRQVDVTVSAKISQSDVNYSGLVTSISSLMTAPKSPPPTTPPPAGAVGVRGAAPGAAAPPIQTLAADLLARANDLTNETNKLSSDTTDFGLAAQEDAVNTCIKNL